MTEDSARRAVLAQKLATGQASNEQVQEALSIVLMAIWSDEDLDERIARKHRELCKECPVRVRFEHEKLEQEAQRRKHESGFSPEPDGMDLLKKILPWGVAIVGTAMAIIAKLTGTSVPVVTGQ